MYAYATIDEGGLYSSSDYGSTWTQTSAPSSSVTYWFSVATSDSGMYVYALNHDTIWMSSSCCPHRPAQFCTYCCPYQRAPRDSITEHAAFTATHHPAQCCTH
jgi:hypothetical protein